MKYEVLGLGLKFVKPLFFPASVTPCVPRIAVSGPFRQPQLGLALRMTSNPLASSGVGTEGRACLLKG